MNGISLAITLIIAIILGIILYKIFKPYFIRHDTTLLFTGGLGSGKSLSTIKTAIILIRKQRFYKYYCWNFFHHTLGKLFKNPHNKYVTKYNNKHEKEIKEGKKKAKKYWKIRARRKKPLLYSNIPIHFKKHIFGTKREWSNRLLEEHIVLLRGMVEYSVVVIDEMPQFINQFNWNEDLVQKNVNEFITFFRHYIAGYLLLNAQAVDDVVVQIRRKLNQATWCFDFHKWLFGLFYTIRMCDIMLSDQVSTMSTTFIEDNTRLHFGFFPPRKTYDTRCYSERYLNVLEPHKIGDKWLKIKTNKVLRLQEYTSPLDDLTTKEQKQEMIKKGEKLWKH